MKRYIVKGGNVKSLLFKVAKHFQVDPRNIKYEILKKKPEFELKVWVENQDDIKNKPDNFFIEIEEEGIFLKVVKIDENKTLTLKRILKELEDKKIKDFDLDSVEKALYSLNQKYKIAEYDKEYYIDSEIHVEIMNNMEATIMLIPPKRGRKTTVEKVLEVCEEKGLKFGIRKKAIKTLIEEEIYNKKAILAKGKEAIASEDAKIVYTFSKNEDSEDEDIKSVDFKKLNLITNIEKDEVLAKKIPIKEGINGEDIYGNEIKPKDPKDVNLSAGKNTYITEDGLYLKSSIDGQVIVKGKNITVEPILTINGNVDYSTGNIDFVGTVVVMGNVISGFEVNAESDIIVEGLVEDAKLDTQGRLIVKNGILGNEEIKNHIYAKEGIKAKFIQNMNVKTEGDIEVNKHILHSNIEAKGKVKVTEGQGIIIGGEIISQEGIEANVAGGKYETPTKLSIGIYGDLITEESAINTEMLLLEENKFKMEKIITDLSNKKDNLNDVGKKKLEECFKKLGAINNRYTILEQKRDELEEEKNQTIKKTVLILKKVYSGVIIRIGRELYLNRSNKVIKTEFFLDKETMEINER